MTVVTPAIIGYSVIKYAYPITTMGAINATSNLRNLFSIVFMVRMVVHR